LVTALHYTNITNHFKEYECTVCALELTNDEKGNKTYLTPELKEINDTLKVFVERNISTYLVLAAVVISIKQPKIIR
jgi:hypothetical protein